LNAAVELFTSKARPISGANASQDFLITVLSSSQGYTTPVTVTSAISPLQMPQAPQPLLALALAAIAAVALAALILDSRRKQTKVVKVDNP
jgi:hypothetical protein